MSTLYRNGSANVERPFGGASKDERERWQTPAVPVRRRVAYPSSWLSQTIGASERERWQAPGVGPRRNSK